MTIVHVSYAHVKDQSDPEKWLDKLDFYTGILDSLAKEATVKSIHCISYNGVLTRNGVEYHFLNLTPWQIYVPLTIGLYVKQLNPDVVVVHGLIFPLHVLFLRLGLNRKVRIVVQHHAERPLTNALRYIQPWADRYIDAYLFCSVHLGYQWVEKGLIKDANKITEIMEVSSSFAPMEQQVARRVTKVTGKRIFVWVGRLHNGKDPVLAVRAFAQFASHNPGVRLYMIHQSSELIQQVNEVIAEENAFDNIILVGKVAHSDLLYWYNSADFIISTSKYEGSGTAVCEGLSCGCVPVLTDIPSFRMMTGDGSIGLLFGVGEISGLVSNLQKCLQLNVAIEKQKVLQRFTDALAFPAIARNMMKLFQSITK